MMPHIGLHMIPEEADLGDNAQLVNAGSRVDFIRFDKGMESGATSIGIAVPLAAIEDAEANTWLIVQTSLTALSAAVAALQAREDAEREGLL